MPRLLVVFSIVLAALVAAGGAGSARLDDAPDVTVRAGGNGQYEVTVQNTSTTLVINSFTFAPGPALTVSGVVRSDAGTCAMSGSTFSCSGLSLGIYHCGCNPGGLVTVTFTGAGDGPERRQRARHLAGPAGHGHDGDDHEDHDHEDHDDAGRDHGRRSQGHDEDQEGAALQEGPAQHEEEAVPHSEEEVTAAGGPRASVRDCPATGRAAATDPGACPNRPAERARRK